MSVAHPANYRVRFKIAAAAMALLSACPVCSYDFPFTDSAIRDANFLGTRPAGMGDDFLAQRAESKLNSNHCHSE